MKKNDRLNHRRPVEQLAQRLRRLERQRERLLDELYALQKVLNKNPDLRRVSRDTSGAPRLRLIVDNTSRR
jgi:ribosomal 50S subunit-associated protein YjgA (DUF615 family)